MKRRATPADRHARRAFTHLEAKRLPEARAEVERALALSPEHTNAACALARIEVAEGNQLTACQSPSDNSPNSGSWISTTTR